MCRVIVWCAVSVFVSTLMAGTLLAAQRYSLGEAVSDDPSETPLIILKDGEAKVEAAIAPEKGGRQIERSQGQTPRQVDRAK